MSTLSDRALAILQEWIQSESLRKHSYAVADSMKHFAQLRGEAWLRQNGWSEEVCRAILSHADYSGVSPETGLEKTLRAVDELSSFVVAVALVRPTKSIYDVDLAAVKKKMKDKAFARAVNREDIVRGAGQLGLPLEEVISNVIAALKADAARLGLAGRDS